MVELTVTNANLNAKIEAKHDIGVESQKLVYADASTSSNSFIL